MCSHSDIKGKSVHSTWYFRTWKRKKNNKKGGKHATLDSRFDNIIHVVDMNKQVYASICNKYNFSDTILRCFEVKVQNSWIADISGLKSCELENKSHEFVKYYI